MKRMHCTTWLAQVLAPTLLTLAGCGDWTAGSAEGGGWGEVQPVVGRGCVDWNDCDRDWRRRHWDDPRVSWCNLPDAGPRSVATADAALRSIATTDSGPGSIALSEAGEAAGSESDAAAAGASPEAGTADAAVADARVGDEVNSCTVGATCPVGTSCVMGSCRTCSGGVCVCQRDDDCPATQICDHTAGTCTQPPPACSSLTTEAACIGRADCTPIYGGMNCTNNMGSPCHSGEANCTCATYSFAACVTRSS